MRLLAPLILCILVAACDRQVATEELTEARSAFANREWNDAERLLEGYLRRNPEGVQRWEAWNMLVEVAHRVRNDERAAAELLETMYLENGSNPERAYDILTRLGELLEAGRDFRRAAEVWGRVLELPGLTPDTRANVTRRLARILVMQRRFPEAEERLRACFDMEGLSTEGRAGCLYDLADLNVASEHLDVAVDLATTLLALEGLPSALRGQAGFLLADALEQRGRFAEALDHFERLRGVYPNDMVIDTRVRHLKGRLGRK